MFTRNLLRPSSVANFVPSHETGLFFDFSSRPITHAAHFRLAVALVKCRGSLIAGDMTFGMEQLCVHTIGVVSNVASYGKEKKELRTYHEYATFNVAKVRNRFYELVNQVKKLQTRCRR